MLKGIRCFKYFAPKHCQFKVVYIMHCSFLLNAVLGSVETGSVVSGSVILVQLSLVQLTIYHFYLCHCRHIYIQSVSEASTSHHC